MKFKYLLPLSCLLGACHPEAPTAAPAPVKALPEVVQKYTLPFYSWTDHYSLSDGEMRFFDIEKLMRDYQLSRLAAVELQNRYRDYLDSYYVDEQCAKKRDNKKSYQHLAQSHYFNNDQLECFTPEVRQKAWDQALAQVKAGKFESGWSEEKAAAAAFIVAFDLDNTLFFHHYDDDRLEMAPGWQETLELVRNNGGQVIFFTAKNDLRADKVLSPEFRQEAAAVFSNNHLIMAPKSRQYGEVIIPSKDLRVIEENLTKTFIVDDNPARIVQFDLLRYVGRWDPQSFTDIDGGNNILTSPQRLTNAVKEIIEAVNWAKEHDTTPAKAFLPYSFSGRQLTNALAIEQFNGDFGQAVEYVRRHPQMVTKIK